MTVNGSGSNPHPLRPLTADELLRARDIVVAQQGGDSVAFAFRSIYLEEPAKADLLPVLIAEHGGPAASKVPPRLAKLIYDTVRDGTVTLTDAVVDLDAGKVRSTRSLPPECQTSYTAEEFGAFYDACVSSDMFKEAMEEFALPEHFQVTIDPWPYGGLDPDETVPRYMQGLVFARDSSNQNPDSNHYGYPIPIIPVMDFNAKKLVRIDRLATGGKDDPLTPTARPKQPKKLFTDTQPSAEYVPELLDRPLRADLKPIHITQPEGASFRVHEDQLVEWQQWRFRIGFTPREGAVLHDVRCAGRPVLHRLSFSEMTVPYGDPRPPFHRKQAFDFGDGGVGRAANSLRLGCDCLGAIHYLDAWVADKEGKPVRAENVVCLHEQDGGVGWKHTNFRTGRAVVTRHRELVVQFIVTLANYEYVFAYKFDLAGGLTLETRATGVVSVVAIDGGKTSAYGNVVSPGVLAQNHQHIFAVRIDPSIDSYEAGDTAVVLEESHSLPLDPFTNPYGNGYEVRRHRLARAAYADAEPRLNRTVRLESATKTNPISGKPVAYKFAPAATQLLLADPRSTQAARAPFAAHHLWVTGHRDGELWAGGEFTNQSKMEVGGVKAMVARGDWFVDDDEKAANGTENGHTNGHSDGTAEDQGRKSSPVVWSVFGLTHNPRVEDWPVMPVEIHQLHIKPADFFTSNPALDVPGDVNKASVLVSCCGEPTSNSKATQNGNGTGVAQQEPLPHLQGSAPDVDPGTLPK